MNILFKYASRERPSWFLRGLQNISHTISKDRNYEVLATCDTDDELMYRQLVIDKANNICKKITWAWGKSKNKIHAINRGMQKAKSNWDVLINFSDDMLFQFELWDSYMETLINDKWGESLDFFAHFNDGYTGKSIPSMSIIGRDYYNRFNRIYPEKYNSLWADNHVMEEAKILDRYHYFEDVIYKHKHPATENIPQDNLYKYNESFYYIDKAIYEQYKLENFGL